MRSPEVLDHEKMNLIFKIRISKMLLEFNLIPGKC